MIHTPEKLGVKSQVFLLSITKHIFCCGVSALMSDDVYFQGRANYGKCRTMTALRRRKRVKMMTQRRNKDSFEDGCGCVYLSVFLCDIACHLDWVSSYQYN